MRPGYWRRRARLAVRALILLAFLGTMVLPFTLSQERGPPRLLPAPEHRSLVEFGGDAVSPFHEDGRALFGLDVTGAVIRRESETLAGMVSDDPRLIVTPLQSTEVTAAIMLVEEAPDRPGGELLFAAQRALVLAFAGDPALGEWLILIADVETFGQRPDGIPPTVFRSSRLHMEEFVTCGATSGVGPCWDALARSATVMIVRGYRPPFRAI